MPIDRSNVLLNVMCFLFPWLGIFVYLSIKPTTPVRARSLGFSVLAGGVIYIALAIAISVAAQRIYVNQYDNLMDSVMPEPTPRPTARVKKAQPKAKGNQSQHR